MLPGALKAELIGSAGMFRCIYCRSVFQRHSLYWELLQNIKVLRSMQQYCQRKTSSGLWDFTGEEYAGILFLIFKLRCPFFFYYYTVFLVRKLDVCLSRPSSETSSKQLKEHLVLFVWKDCSVSQKSNLKLILRKMLFVLIKERNWNADSVFHLILWITVGQD